MHEITCPSCSTSAQFNLKDKILICQICSTSFMYDARSGRKEIFSDHYIVPNTLDVPAVKATMVEWFKRMHYRAEGADKEFVVIDIHGISIPYWVTSLDVHTLWKGLVRRGSRSTLNPSPGADYLFEEGQFRRSYRWAVSARRNLCEQWGVTRLHEPNELIHVEWDGFPLDSTFSRGLMEEPRKNSKNVYDAREFFDYKYSNGLAILGVQVSEEEALRRTKLHVELYHYKLAKVNVDYLVDIRSELEIAGVQLVHLPFWHATYQYRPKSVLRYFYPPKNKNVLIEGYTSGVLEGELALVYKDKIILNAILCSIASLLFFLLGAIWHPAFFLVSLFGLIVAGASAYISYVRSQNKEEDIEEKANLVSTKTNELSGAA